MERFSQAWQKARLELSKKAFEQNKASILAALNAAGVSQARVDYSGSGDDGNASDLCCNIKDGAQIKTPFVSVPFARVNGETEPALDVSEKSLSEALYEMCEDAISLCGHDDYQNGTGGGGTLTFDVQAGELQLEHYDIIEERDETTHVL